MKKIVFIALCILLALALTDIVLSQELQKEYLDQQVQIKLIPIETTVVDGTVTMSANLRVKNPFDFPLRNVVTQVEEAVDLVVSPTFIKIGNVGAGASVLAEEVVTVSYPVPSQDTANPERRLKWDVDYVTFQDLGKGHSTGGLLVNKSRKPKVGHDLLGLHISEIMFFPKDPKTEPEWIELYNGSDQEINITGYDLCNASGTVYSFPETVPLVPPGGFVLVVFDGEGSRGDDVSFKDDNLVILHVGVRNVFADEDDICALFSGKPHSRKTIQGFVTWGVMGKTTKNKDRIKRAKAFLRDAQSRKLWGKNAVKVFVRGPKIEKLKGPGPTLGPNGTLGIAGAPTKSGSATWAIFAANEASPGVRNSLPAPLLFLPENATQTSGGLSTFSWFPPRWAHHYHFQICSDPECATTLINNPNLMSPHFRPQEPFDPGTYYWRARAVDAQGNAGSWSETRILLIIGSPEPKSGLLEGESKGQTNPLGVVALAARKDTNLLCLDGCERSSINNRQWDGPHTVLTHYWDHEASMCWAVAISMMNRYFGGTIMRDEVTWRVKGQDAAPEGDLAHNQGAVDTETTTGLTWALSTVAGNLNYSRTRPTEAQLTAWINTGRPVMYSTPIHWMVVDGYRTVSGVFQARFLNTDNDGSVEWRPFSTHAFDSYYVPNLGLTPRNTDPRVSNDGDGDGIMDFDEDERFPTDGTYPDTDWDGVPDKPDVASYTFRTAIDADVDSDGIRGEADPDSDNGGLQDGLEDLDHDGRFEPGDDETDPHDASDDSGVDLDLVLVIDTTGSMWDDIAAVKVAAVDIVNTIDANAKDYRVAVVSFEDFPIWPYGDSSCGDYMYHDVLNFSDDKSQIISAIQSLTLRCGADWPESHYSALIHCFDKNALGGWRDGVGKVAILMSDAPPHDPEPQTGYTSANVIQAAINLDPAIIYPILIGGDPTARAYFNALAGGTGGTVFEATNAEEVVDTIIEAIETILNAPVAEADGPYTACVGSSITFDGSGSYDIGGEIVLYEWDLDNDGVYDVLGPIVTHAYAFEYSGSVTLRVTDNDGLTGFDTAAVIVGDTTPPEVEVKIPQPNTAVQDGVTFSAEASDNCELDRTYFYLRELNGGTGIPIGYENLEASFNTSSGNWEYSFDTIQLDDGYYILLAKATDISGNEGWSEPVPFSIRNWAVLELLPPSDKYRAGRTMPVKFSLRIAEAVDSAMPFVYNEKLEIRIYKSSDPGNILQTSLFGDTSKDYRIDTAGELYITNFKTSKKPAQYVVEIWRMSKNFLVGSFTFETVK